MSATETIDVRLRGLPNGESRGTLTIERWAKGERLRRAVTGLLGVWACALGILFVPGAHIVSIPLFFLVAPLLFFVRCRTESVVTGGSGVCPECGAPFTIVRAKEQWPLFDICTGCKKHVKIERC